MMLWDLSMVFFSCLMGGAERGGEGLFEGRARCGSVGLGFETYVFDSFAPWKPEKQ